MRASPPELISSSGAISISCPLEARRKRTEVYLSGSGCRTGRGQGNLFVYLGARYELHTGGQPDEHILEVQAGQPYGRPYSDPAQLLHRGVLHADGEEGQPLFVLILLDAPRRVLHNMVRL